MSEQILKLSEFQHSRLRTEMWLGSRDPKTQMVLEYDNGKPVLRETKWVPAVFTAFREIVDNAIDELVTHKAGDTLRVTYNPKTMVVTVEDNGRGIPFTKDKKHNQYLATMALTETKAGRNFTDDRGATRGLNGVGGSIVNFCSEYLQMDIHREGKHFSQRFHEGDGSREAELVIEDPLILPLKDALAKLHGTRIEFKLSRKVFKDVSLPEEFIRARMFEIALCYPHLKVSYNGHRVQTNKLGTEKTLFGDIKPISFEINEPGFSSRFWLVPSFFEGVSEFHHSMVNAIPTFDGGIHIDTFRKGFFSGLLGALESRSKREKLVPNRSDIADGILLYNITEMDAPTFDSQSKTRLINENVGAVIRKALDDPETYKTIIRKNPEWIDEIYERCRTRTTRKDDDDAKKAAKKNARAKVAELKDACGADRSKCILFLAEGLSAISGMIEARDPNIHGGLPLRGKVLNVFDEHATAVLKNDALAKIMNSIGLQIGERANRHTLRYGKVYITTDADEDGKNIAALLINFFYRFWPELFDAERAPFIYIFDTPFIVAVKGKDRKYWYNEDYSKFDTSVYNKGKGWDITRAKGLAALKKDDWKWVLANPKAREIIEDGDLSTSLELLFNPDLADSRKVWIGL